MRLVVLGSGSCELRAERSSPAYLVEAGGTSVMLDLGQGAWRRLFEAGRRPLDLAAVLLSHHHLDHLGDLPPLLFALKNDPLLSSRARLTLVGHVDLAPHLERMWQAFDLVRVPEAGVLEVSLVRPGSRFQLGALEVCTARADHVATSLAYRLSCNGVHLVYLGDSAACTEVEQLAAGADLLVAHCAGTDDHPKPGHLHPAAAGDLAATCGVRRLLLSHFYEVVDPIEAETSARRLFAGEVIAAQDLMEVALTTGS